MEQDNNSSANYKGCSYYDGGMCIAEKGKTQICYAERAGLGVGGCNVKEITDRSYVSLARMLGAGDNICVGRLEKTAETS